MASLAQIRNLHKCKNKYRHKWVDEGGKKTTKRMKIIIKNNGYKEVYLKALFGCVDEKTNFGLPDFVSIKLESDIKDLTYKRLLEHFGYKSVIIRFLKSTNNRHLFFYYMNGLGAKYAMEPSLNLDGTKRSVWKGEKIDFFGEKVYEGDLFEPEYLKNWNPNKWNIADTHEECLWTLSNYIEVLVDAKKEFVIEFEIIK